MPSPNLLLVSSQKKLALSCEMRPPAPMKATEPAAARLEQRRRARQQLGVVSPHPARGLAQHAAADEHARRAQRRISFQSSSTGVTLVKKRCPPMSNR